MRYLSVIVCGRNDEYYVSPSFIERFRDFVKSLVWSFNGFSIEICFVEYNNPIKAPHLVDIIENVGVPIKWIIVPNEFHKKITENPNMTMCEYYAKNIGLRRIDNRGQYVLVGNPDIIFKNKLSDKLNPKNLYCASKWHVTKDGTPRDKKAANINGALGDFMLAHIDIWNRMKGFRQEVVWGALDSLFAQDCVKSNISCIGLTNFVLWHIDHHEDNDFLINQRDKRCETRIAKYMIPPKNDREWGFPNINFDEVVV